MKNPEKRPKKRLALREKKRKLMETPRLEEKEHEW